MKCMQHLAMKLSEKLDDADRDGRKDIYKNNKTPIHPCTLHMHRTELFKLIGISKNEAV